MDRDTDRRSQIAAAAVGEIAKRGSLEIPVARIARRAGVSPALAFHYFGGKDELFLAAMRHVLSEYRAEAVAGLRAAATPAARIDAVLRASFSPTAFRADAIAAWLAFYPLARRAPAAARLLAIYRRRLHATLVHDLRPLTSDPEGAARRMAALIDGLYLRLGDGAGADAGAARRALADARAALAAEIAR